MQEILQDAFLLALRAEPPSVSPEPIGWVFVIALNRARDIRRRNERRGPTASLDEVGTQHMTTDTKTPEPGARLERAEALRAARKAIGRLAEPEREVFLLRVSAELSFEAAALALGIPVGTAKTRMRVALAKLRISLSTFDPNLGVEAATGSPKA